MAAFLAQPVRVAAERVKLMRELQFQEKEIGKFGTMCYDALTQTLESFELDPTGMTVIRDVAEEAANLGSYGKGMISLMATYQAILSKDMPPSLPSR